MFPAAKRLRARGTGQRALFLVAAMLTMAPGAASAQGAWARVAGPAAGPPAIYGGYGEGCIAGAVALPSEGPGYQVIRLGWRRHFGHPDLVAFVQELGAQAGAAGLGTLLVADLSQPRGGPISGHVSHEIGLDVDIWLRLDLPALPAAERSNPDALSMVDALTREVDPGIWGSGQATIIRLAAEDPRVARIFVNPAIKRALCAQAEPEDAAWLRVVVPWEGHDAHMHVRLHCPADQLRCEGQGPPPEGSGCDIDGEGAGASRGDLYGRGSAPRPPGVLPRQCNRVYGLPTAQ